MLHLHIHHPPIATVNTTCFIALMFTVAYWSVFNMQGTATSPLSFTASFAFKKLYTWMQLPRQILALNHIFVKGTNFCQSCDSCEQVRTNYFILIEFKVWTY